ncbi:MAG TPA: hypothetical protein VK208_08165 [Pyrinomonadaceae bacterium]|nr:hypothetical protein [Pyrinomonadaceae bacterium]
MKRLDMENPQWQDHHDLQTRQTTRVKSPIKAALIGQPLTQLGYERIRATPGGGVFPEGKEVLAFDAALGGIALERVGACGGVGTR